MKLTEPRYLRVVTGPVTRFVYIGHFRSPEYAITRHPTGRMTYTERYWRRDLLDRLSPGMEIGRRVDNPLKGVDSVEAIPDEVYMDAQKDYWHWSDEMRELRRQKAKAMRQAKAQALGHAPGTRRVDLEL